MERPAEKGEKRMPEITMFPCPFCGNEQIDFWDETDGFFYCEKCGLCGPRAHDRILAADRWNGLPRRLRWTKKKPTQEGYYWYKDKQTSQIIALITTLDNELIVHAANRYANYPVRMVDLNGEWAGPIPEPEEK